jgi:hypothetical protein
MVKGVPTSNLINTLLYKQVSLEFDYIQVSCNSHLDAVDTLFCLEQPAEEIKTVLLMNCFADSKVWLCVGSGSMVMNYNTGWPEKNLDFKEADFYHNCTY